jgi:TolB protein
MDADGSNQVKLIGGPHEQFHPTWSPDGTKLAFTNGSNGKNFQIYVMNADGSNVRKIVDLDEFVGSAPSWSPSGDEFAFELHRSTAVFRLDGSSGSLVSPSTAMRPSWSAK